MIHTTIQQRYILEPAGKTSAFSPSLLGSQLWSGTNTLSAEVLPLNGQEKLEVNMEEQTVRVAAGGETEAHDMEIRGRNRDFIW